MRENRLSITIHRPIAVVFEFTTNPNNTPKWILSIEEEVAEEYPPKIDTIYRNRGKGTDWDYYKVVAIEKDKVFLLSDLDGNYFVRYSYKKIRDDATELEYFEWMKERDLKNPFTKSVLQTLKSVLEK